MEVEFNIPISLADLQTKQSLTDYSVSNVFPARILPNKIADLKSALRSFQKDTVIQHFDTLYSVLSDQTDQEGGLQEAAWACLIKCLENLHVTLRSALEGSNVRDAQLRNSLSMSLYLTTEYVERLETVSNRPTTEQLVAGKKKGKSKVKNSDNLSMDWSRERHRAVKYMIQLLSLPIQRQWDPPMVEQNLINCVGNCCYKLLHNAATVKTKDTKEDIFRLLGTLVKRHKYSLSAAIQALESLKLYDHMASTMAEAMSVIAREFSFPRTAQDLLREISSLSADYLQKDSTAARSYSLFLTELADMIPDIILPLISTLLPFLESDPPSMRNAMLLVLGKLVMNLLTGDQLDDNHKNMRDEFLSTLCEHLHDCNGFVRAKALQVLISIVEARTLPVSMYGEVSHLVQGRLLDRLPNVRKYALQLMAALVSHNPYGGTLSDKELFTTLENEKSSLSELRSKVKKAAIPEAAVITPAENWEAMLPETEKAVEEYFEDNSDPMDTSTSLDDGVTIDSVKEELIQLLTQCKPLDAVKLLVRSQQGFLGTDLEIAASVDDEPTEKGHQEVMDKLKEIFLSQKPVELVADEEAGDSAEVNELITKQEIVVKYLEETAKFCDLIKTTMPTVCTLLSSKTPTDVIESIQFVVTTVQFGVTEAMHGLAAMLKLIWVPDSNIKSAVVQAFKLLYLFSDETGDSREPEKVVDSLIALTKAFGGVYGLLTSWEEMVAEFVRSEAITSKVLQLLWQIFTKKLPSTSDIDSKIGLKLLAMASKARPALISSNMDNLLSEGLGERATQDFLLARDVCFALLTLPRKNARFPVDHEVVTGLSKLMSEGILDTDQAGWIPLMEQAIKFIFSMSETPDETCALLIRNIYTSISGSEGHVNTPLLTRFVSLIGEVALCQLTYLEGDVLQRLKERRQKSKKSAATPSVSGGDELGQTVSDDVETEVVMKVIEEELLQDKNLLGCFLPLLTHIVVNRHKFDDKGLQTAATLSLGKFMLLSPEICRQNLRLYFTVLEKSNYTEVKTNAIVALSDMVFRYPNDLEPWTPNFYARLRDECATVRKSTLMVMTRLILNDMVKVKGQISEIANCLVDPQPAIQRLTSQFFYELANKGRALYNVLLDIVSRLSDPEIGVDDEQFQTICTELFSHTNNDKQSESLMERFLLRFRATTDERQWRHLSFCLSRLTYSEKSIKKLIELFSCYADKLSDEEIYANFVTILDKATQKLKPKPGAKEMLAELSAKIEVAHNRGVEDVEALENATTADLNKTVAAAKANRRKLRNKRKSRRTSSQSAFSDSDDESDGSTCSRLSTSSSVSVTQGAGARRSARKAAAMKPIENLLSELEEESEEENVPEFTKSTVKSKSARDKKKLVFSSSDEEEEVSAAAVISPARPPRRPVRVRNR